MLPCQASISQSTEAVAAVPLLFLVAVSLPAAQVLELNQFGGAEVVGWPKGVNQGNVMATYGKARGVKVVAGGYDVCSLDYTHRVLRESEFHALIRLKYPRT